MFRGVEIRKKVIRDVTRNKIPFVGAGHARDTGAITQPCRSNIAGMARSYGYHHAFKTLRRRNDRGTVFIITSLNKAFYLQ